jgi:hypothetical protein
MSSAEKEAKFRFLEEKERRDKIDRLRDRASRILYDEHKIGFCGTDEELRQRERLINSKAHELGEREEYERLKKIYDR